jgi:hypothetical protein
MRRLDVRAHSCACVIEFDILVANAWLARAGTDRSYDAHKEMESITMAFGIFLGVYLVVYQRWRRICVFENAWGQRDIVYDVYVVNPPCARADSTSHSLLVLDRRAPVSRGQPQCQ